MENLVTRLSYHIAVAALQRQNELHLFAMCLAINIYVVIRGSKKNDKMNQVVSLLVLSTKISPKKKKKNHTQPEYQHESVLHFGEKSYDIHHTPRINEEDESVAMALACPESMFCHVLIRKFTNCSWAFPIKATKSRERRSQALLTLVSHVIKKETKMARICLKQKKWGEKKA